MKIDFEVWKFKQKFQYYIKDFIAVLNPNSQYNFNDFCFWRKKKIYRKNSVRTYYIIRRRSGRGKIQGTQTMGICGILLFNLADILYAEKKGYIPVIDMKNYSNTYLRNEDIGKYNAWEFFFEQDYTEIEKNYKDNIIYSDGILNNDMFGYDQLMESEYDKLDIRVWKKVFNKYITFNSIVEMKAKIYCLKEKFSTLKVLGVLCRGSDFLHEHPKNHPIQPSVEMVIKKIDEFQQKQRYDRIFLATEDKNIYIKLKNEYKDQLMVLEEPDIFYKSGYYADNIPDSTYERRKNGINYLTNIIILSKCNSLIGGITSGMIVTLLLNENFEEIYYWRLGYYN